MAAIVDEYLDGPLDTDEIFPCKGCGEVTAQTNLLTGEKIFF
jgi:hypothetical protein